MSVARSAYRQLLRVGKKVSDRYADPNDMCFALFGLLVTRHDFINAGYGSTYAEILRTCFLRPSVTDDPHDTTSARVSAAFDALRRLNDINASTEAFRIRELRRQMAETVEEKSAGESSGAAPATAETAGMGKKAKEADLRSTEAATAAPQMDASTAPGPATSAAAESSTSPSLSSPSATSSSSSSPLSAEAAVALAKSSSAARVGSHAKSGTTTYRLDEGVNLVRGSVLIERSSRQRLQNFPRHCVVLEPISMDFPPYRYCVPPEPAYLLAVRNEFVLHGITDVLLAVSATSIYNEHRQAYLQQQQQQQQGDHQEEEREENEEAGLQAGKASATTAESERPLQRGFPTSRAELWELVRKIPTRTIFQTDVLEVEITTEYVCSNPAAASSAAGAPSSRVSKDGGFTATTPLKGGSATSASHNSPGSTSGSAGASRPSSSPFSSDSSAAASEEDETKAHLFLYYVYVRNRGPRKNPRRWHAQVLSHHLIVVDVAQAQVLEMGRPGVMGNFPLLPPGASHCFESGTTLSGPEGLIRGSIQLNLFNDAGEMMMLDAAIAPTRLTVEVTSAKGFTSSKSVKEELVQRTSEGGDAAEKEERVAPSAASAVDESKDGKK